MKKTKEFIKKRKILSIIILILIILIAYFIYSKASSNSEKISYVFANVKRNNISTTVTGTGQIIAFNQVEIKSKASGELSYLNTQANGNQIKKGTLIAKINTRDADIALESARLAYQKLEKPADESTILKAEISLDDAIKSNTKSYDDAFNIISNTFVELPNIINGLNDIFYASNGYLQTENIRMVGQTAVDLQSKAGISFDKAKANYNSLLNKYKNLSRESSTSTIESFLSETYDLTKSVSDTLKNAQNAIDFIIEQRDDTSGNTTANNIASWTTTTNSNLASILNAKNTISSSIQNINQKRIDLLDTKNGTDELDLASQMLNLRQAEYAYSDYFIYAPFDGVLAKLSVKSTDTVSNGTVIGTIVSAEKIASITLNEVDVSKVKIGQKANLTFDAIDGLNISGTVSTVDLIGTVSQGVVNYNVEITLDSIDERIKSGMSVSASIITESKNDTLTVPNSAVKKNGNSNYVEILSSDSNNTVLKRKVEIGLSNDTVTEILSGLEENEKIIIKTNTNTSTVKVSSTPSLFGTGTRTSGTTRIPRN